MTTTTQSKRTGLGPIARWSGLAAFAAAALFGASAANAAPPASGTQIGNYATASYLDPSGSIVTSTSNQVWTFVTQVGSFTLTADGAQTGAAGSVLQVPHVLTNTGNGSDTFTITVAENNLATTPDFAKIEVYLDSGSGLPTGSPLCTTTSAATPCTTTVQTVAGGAALKFVVSYSLPSTATPGTWPSNMATVTATAGTTALYTTPTLTNVDTLTLTTSAAFSVGKSISTPSVSGPTAWPTPLTSGPRNTPTVYTINYANNGAAGAPLYIKDVLPAGLTYTAGSGVWSSLAGVALTDADNGTTQTNGTPDGTIEYRVVGSTIEAWIQNVGPNVSGTLSFAVKASTTAAIGTTQTTNVAQYNPTVCSSTPTSIATAAAACSTLSSTNGASFTVMASYDVVFGVQDATNGTPNGAPDTVTVAQAAAGSAAKFTYTVTNNGNDTDTFDLTIPSNTFPPGTVFTWLDSSGAVPLQNTNGNAFEDTGPVAPGASVTVVLQAQLPGTSAGFLGSTFTARATSAGAVLAGVTTEYDAVAGVLTTITGSVADLQNAPPTAIAGDIGPGPNTTAAFTVTTNNGTVAQFPLQVVNNDTGSLTYNLSYSQNATFPGSMPAGWSASFSSSACAAPTPITTLTAAAGTTTPFYACVTVPLTATAATQPVYFQVQSTTPSALTGATVTDGVHDAVTVTVSLSYTYSVTPFNTGSAALGGSVAYAHNILNTGNQSCGAFTVTATPSAAALAKGWSTALYLDVNGDGILDGNDTLITTGTLPALAAGGLQKILVKVFTGGTAAVGDQEVVTLTVTDTQAAPNTCVIQGTNPTDTTKVIQGQIRVDKSQAADDNCDSAEALAASLPLADIYRKPGQCVVYRVTATNQGAAPVTNVQITDAIPAHTNYAGSSPSVTQPTVQCTSTNVTGTSVAYATAGVPVNTVSCGSATNTVQPGGSITLQFTVQVDK